MHKNNVLKTKEAILREDSEWTLEKDSLFFAKK